MEKNSSPAETSGKQKVRSAEVGTDILKALAELSPATSLSRLAEHVGMPASKVHRYLQALIASGFAVQDASTNHYSLGREALRVGLAALDSMDVLKSAAAGPPTTYIPSQPAGAPSSGPSAASTCAGPRVCSTRVSARCRRRKTSSSTHPT